LHVLREQGEYDVTALLTTCTSDFDRVSMHGVRRALAEAQSAAAGVPLRWVELPYPCPNTRYEAIMGEVVREAVSEGVSHVAFGDLFLQEVRAYRERMLAGSGLTPVFPIWQSDTARLAKDMIASGLRAVLVCVDPKQLSPVYAGRIFDDCLLGELPAGVDPCGENGEFHTFCCAGPMFERPIPVRAGACVERDGFMFSDLLVEAEGTCA
jgi:diphthamide synthase (EF-2-diphthine--ammonia ligase)